MTLEKIPRDISAALAKIHEVFKAFCPFLSSCFSFPKSYTWFLACLLFVCGLAVLEVTM